MADETPTPEPQVPVPTNVFLKVGARGKVEMPRDEAPAE